MTEIFDAHPDDQPDVNEASREAEGGLSTDAAATSIVDGAHSQEYDDLSESVVEIGSEDVGKGNVHLFVPFLLGDSLDEDSQLFRDAYDSYLNGPWGKIVAVAGEEGFRDGDEAASQVRDSYQEQGDKGLVYGFVTLLEDRDQYNKPLRFQSVENYLDDILSRLEYGRSDLQSSFEEQANAISEAYSNSFISGVAYRSGVKQAEDGSFILAAETKESAERIRQDIEERREARDVKRVKAARQEFVVDQDQVEDQFNPSLTQPQADGEDEEEQQS